MTESRAGSKAYSFRFVSTDPQVDRSTVLIVSLDIQFRALMSNINPESQLGVQEMLAP